MKDIIFSDLQNKLITEEKLSNIYSAIIGADIINHYSDEAKKAVSNWVQGGDVSDTVIGDVTVAEIVAELNCSTFQAICVLNSIEHDPDIFSDAVLVLWKDSIR